MWKGKFDEHMKDLFIQYDEKFGCDPDTYEEIIYEAMDYDEFSGYIEKCLKENKSIPKVVK